MNYICSKCSAPYALEASPIKCTCNALLDFDFSPKPLDFAQLKFSNTYSLWRYLDALPFSKEDTVWKQATMGEGFTPLLPLHPDNPNLKIKCEYFAPTLSFKDRGAVVLMAMAKKMKINEVIADSSGNAGTAIAAYGTRLGIKCNIYVPENTSEKKILQIKAHHASVYKISGSREQTAQAALEAVAKQKIFYASHIYNPLFYEGTKTYLYEIFEQSNGKLPSCLIIPIGNGTLVLGVYKALLDLKNWGYITSLPKIIGVQAENCSPLAQAFMEKQDYVSPTQTKETLAEGIAIATPARGESILKAIRATHGDILTVDEASILKAQQTMANQGIYVEITSAANYAAYEKYITLYPEARKEEIVLPACGAGLKSS